MRGLSAAFLVLLALGAAGCDDDPGGQVANSGGNARHGAKLIASYGCGACHSVPGVALADGHVGPPLDTIGRRTVIAGVVPNTPVNMITWLRTPQSVVPGNVMPDMGISDHDARDIATYLYTLR